MQGPYSGAQKTSGLGFEHIKVHVNNLISLFLLSVVWLFYITFN